GHSLDELICGVSALGTKQRLGEDGPSYLIGEATSVARDEKEHALLLRYRTLSAKRRAALLDLIRPGE
ncbi:MAG: hypothetical protein J0H45_01425, partial [Stenotrophomonas nitritireducens]|nr:hypothetical protein [Stenotrophomonas nitritireducens]